MSRARLRVCTGLLVVAIAVGGCGSGTEPTESPESPKPSLAVSCSDDYRGPTDGTVHDATGIGTTPTVAGDPSPGAAGLGRHSPRHPSSQIRSVRALMRQNCTSRVARATQYAPNASSQLRGLS